MTDTQSTQAAVLVGQIRVHDHELWQQYVTGVAQSLEPFDAEILFRGHQGMVLAGDSHFEQVVVIRFASSQQLDQWYHSQAYQQLIPIRDQAAEVLINRFLL